MYLQTFTISSNSASEHVIHHMTFYKQTQSATASHRFNTCIYACMILLYFILLLKSTTKVQSMIRVKKNQILKNKTTQSKAKQTKPKKKKENNGTSIILCLRVLFCDIIY